MMQSLLDSGAEEHTTIFFGAGASTTSGLPNWDELVTRLLVSSGSVPDNDAAALLLSRQDPLLVAESARSAYGGDWLRKLRAALYERVESTDFSPLHRAAVAHALSGDGTDTSLVTLNFDDLLEQALAKETGLTIRSRTGEKYDRSAPWTVHHLHGLVSPASVKDVVLTLTEFLDLLGKEESWQLEFLKGALDKGALIIAGTSYRDPDVRQWLHSALKGAPKEHATIVLLAREGFDVSKADYAQLDVALADQWKAVGVRPMLLHDFSDAAQVIRELRYVNNKNYSAPQERARAIWQSHFDGFSTLQTKYVELLEADAAQMKDALDVESLNLSLWLADGEGRLVRWAAQDRSYKYPESLRTVETGYDSPWIAGKSLGSDALLIEDLPEGSTRRWRSVLALPIPVPHPDFPVITSAVLTIGLPDKAERYEASNLMWGAALETIGDAWGDRLASVLAQPSSATI